MAGNAFIWNYLTLYGKRQPFVWPRLPYNARLYGRVYLFMPCTSRVFPISPVQSAFERRGPLTHRKSGVGELLKIRIVAMNRSVVYGIREIPSKSEVVLGAYHCPKRIFFPSPLGFINKAYTPQQAALGLQPLFFLTEGARGRGCDGGQAKAPSPYIGRIAKGEDFRWKWLYRKLVGNSLSREKPYTPKISQLLYPPLVTKQLFPSENHSGDQLFVWTVFGHSSRGNFSMRLITFLWCRAKKTPT